MSDPHATLARLETDLLEALGRLQCCPGIAPERKAVQRLELTVMLEYVRELRQDVCAPFQA
ncbi:MAG: hypothetical protein SFU83_00485 [Meiothermus sp.]|nr:hypothetical protein [Meiothermus sp.]